MLAEHFGSHVSQKGQINLISWPDRYILKDASLDTYISMTYVWNESQNAPLAFFPLYIFWISFMKWKWTAKQDFFSKWPQRKFDGLWTISAAMVNSPH